MLYSRIFLWLILLTIISRTTCGLGASYLDNVVTYCENKIRRFEATKEKYAKKGEKQAEASTLVPPPIDEFQQTVSETGQSQRIFECITDFIDGIDDQNLILSYKYQSLVNKCMSKNTTPQCDPFYPYRSINGTCNNLINKNWGSGLSCMWRAFPANYEGASGIRKSVRGNKRLPNPRIVSLKIVKPKKNLTMQYNALFTLFGQVVAHDIAQFIFSSVNGQRIDCCENARGPNQHPECIPILIRPDDPFYSKRNISCMNIARVVPCSTCTVGKRLHLNQVSSYIDCSLTYGETDERAKSLRRNDGTGKLRSQNVECGELMPPDTQSGSTCGNAAKQQYCFNAGDNRANQHTSLMIFQTLLLREHNRIADKLKIINPHWDDERLYQESRKILIAEFQVIVYKDYLPVLLGPNLMHKHGLSIGGGSKYDFTVNPSISEEFDAAAFRVHSIIPGRLVEGENYNYLKNLYSNAVPIYNDRTSSFLTKLACHPGETYNLFEPTDLTHWLYRKRRGTFGFDLAAIDTQRGRDVGLPTYSQVIEYLEGRPGTIKKFNDLKEYLVPECQYLLKNTYKDVRDIDFWSGLICEKVPHGMIIAPVATEIIAGQFQRLKCGDRFFFEHDYTLTNGQRQTLLKASLSKLICDNSKVDRFQPNAMLVPIGKNSLQDCSAISGVDLKMWRERISQH